MTDPFYDGANRFAYNTYNRMRTNRLHTFLTFEYPPVSGGIAALCRDLVAGLKRLGLSLRVLTQGGGAAEHPLVERVSNRRPLRELLALLRLKPNEFCLASIWYPEGLIAAVSGAKPFVLMAHGLELMEYHTGWRKWFWQPLRRWVFSKADYVVVNSLYTKGLVEQTVPGKRIEVLKMPVDTKRFRVFDSVHKNGQQDAATDGKIVLGSVSRLEKYKGYEMVFKALSGLEEGLKERICYRIAGTGPDAIELRRRAKELGVSSMIEWLGWVDESELPSFYNGCDLFVLCSQQDAVTHKVEGFGIVFLEAQACGVPVVGTRTGGIECAIEPGKGGWLVESDDIVALRQLLSDVVTNRKLIESQGQLARQRIEEEFSEEQFDKRLGEIFSEELKAIAQNNSRQRERENRAHNG